MRFLPVGIDPGLQGGCALVLGTQVLFAARAKVVKLPQTKVESGIFIKGKTRRDDQSKEVSIYDPIAAIDLLRQCDQLAASHDYCGVAVFLEEPQSMQNRDSHASYLSMGRCIESWEFASHKLGIPFYVVNPKHWKNTEGLTSDKQTSLDRVAAYFVNPPTLVATDHNIAEAALLAAWAAKHRPDCLTTEIIEACST